MTWAAGPWKLSCERNALKEDSAEDRRSSAAATWLHRTTVVLTDAAAILDVAVSGQLIQGGHGKGNQLVIEGAPRNAISAIVEVWPEGKRNIGRRVGDGGVGGASRYWEDGPEGGAQVDARAAQLSPRVDGHFDEQGLGCLRVEGLGDGSSLLLGIGGAVAVERILRERDGHEDDSSFVLAIELTLIDRLSALREKVAPLLHFLLGVGHGVEVSARLAGAV